MRSASSRRCSRRCSSLILFPQALILVGRVLLASDIPAALEKDAPLVPAIIGQAVLTAGLLASLGLAVASFTPRRAIATAAIFAVVLIPPIAVAVIAQLSGGDVAGWVSLVSPPSILEGANAFFYGAARAGPRGSDLPGAGLRRRGHRDGRGPLGRARRPLSHDRAVTDAGQTVPSPAPIVLDRASRWYGNVVAINDVSFEVGPGITGLLGPNGAGKSTILGMIAGLLPPSSGRVTLLGEPAWQHPSVYRQVGLVPERESVPGWLTGLGFVTYAARLQGIDDPDAAARTALGTVDLLDAAGRRTATYSKGMRQRVLLAAALVHDPPVLLLDEPFNGLDPRQRLHIIALLRRLAEAGRTIVFSSHVLEEVERLAGTIIVVYAGRLAASGDFRAIRRLMTDHPHTYTIRSSDDRRLGAALLGGDAILGAELADGRLSVRTADLAGFGRRLPRLAREAGVSLFEVVPTDESLESVFAYLVQG